MSTFEVKVYKLKIETHPNADAIELARVGDYVSIVRKGDFSTGDLGIYIPEGSVVPKWIIASLGLTGKLAGPQHNRVKAIKLRGILSQGLIFPLKWCDEDQDFDAFLHLADGSPFGVDEGVDVTSILGIEKYEPPIPTQMAGEVWNAFGMTINYDIENIKKYPDVFVEGEPVIFTEKLHGTWTCFGYHPDAPFHIVTSKGLSSRGVAFKFNEANQNNLYLRALDSTAPFPDGVGGHVIDRAIDYVHHNFGERAFYILGETFGAGVQDLQYGLKAPAFRVFDIYVGYPGRGRYLNSREVSNASHHLGVQHVPILYKGPFSKEVVDKFTSGKEAVSGTEANIREGIVIRPMTERTHDEIGRVVLKSVSEAYLLRKGEVTEFN